MCGIVAYMGPRNGVPVVLDGLRKLEYRGYDSAGIAILNGKKIDIYRSVGKLIDRNRGKTPLPDILQPAQNRQSCFCKQKA